MSNMVEEYEDNPVFLTFVNEEFDRTAVNATVEELAEFAFGSMAEAIKGFEKHTKELTRDDS